MLSNFSDTCHFIIYNDHTGDLIYDGLFACDQSDFDEISNFDWHNLLIAYDGISLLMKNPKDKQHVVVWNIITSVP